MKMAGSEPNYVLWIVGIVVAIIAVGIGYPRLTGGDGAVAVPFNLQYSLNPIDIASGTVGMYVGTPLVTKGDVCLPSFGLGSVLPSNGGARAVVEIQGASSQTQDFGRWNVDVASGYYKTAKFCNLKSGAYQGVVTAYKDYGNTQTKSFSFIVP